MTIADWAPLIFVSAAVLALLLFFSVPEHYRYEAGIGIDLEVLNPMAGALVDLVEANLLAV